MESPQWSKVMLVFLKARIWRELGVYVEKSRRDILGRCVLILDIHLA